MLRRKMRYLVVFSVLTVGLAALGVAMAQQGPPRGYGNGPGPGPGPGAGYGARGGGFGDGPGGPVMRVFMELDLSDEQRTQVRSLMQEAMDGELGRLLQNRREQRRAVGRLIHDPAAEESAVLDAVRAAAGEAEQLALEQHRLTVALFGVLDETQRAQAAELLEELPDRLQGWGRGRRGQRRGPAAAPMPTPAPTPAG